MPRPLRRLWKGHADWLLSAGVAAAALVLFFWPVFARGWVFFHGDIFRFSEPVQEFHRACLRAGQLPIWNSLIGCGYPQLAEGQIQAFYPPAVLLAALLPAPTALSALVLLHLWLAGLFAAALARTLGAGPWGMAAAALIGALNGFMIARIIHPMMLCTAAWVPLALALTIRGLRTRSVGGLAPLALVIGLQALAGSPPVLFYTCLAVVATALTASGQGDQKPSLKQRLVFGIGGPALGLLLAAVQLLPTQELGRESLRVMRSRWNYVTDYSMPPPQYLSLLLPNLFGNEAWGTYIGPVWQFEHSGYVGSVAAALAVVGALVCGRRARPLWLVVLLGLFMSMGRLNPLFHLLQYLPGFSQFRAPARYVVLVCFATAGLAGAALPRKGGPESGPSRAIEGILALCGLAWIAATLAFVLPAAKAYPSASVLIRQIVAAAVGVALAVAAAQLARRHKVRTWLAGCLCMGLLATDLAFFAWQRTPLAPREFYQGTPEVISPIKQRGEWGRVLVWETDVHGPRGFADPKGWAADLKSAFALREALPPNSAQRFGLDSADVFVALALSHYLPAYHAARTCVRDIARTGTRGEGRAFLDLLGIRYLVSAVAFEGSRMRVIHDGRMRVYENETALPFCWAVSRVGALSDPLAAYGYVMRDTFDPRREAIVESPVAAPLSGGGEVRVRSEASWLDLGRVRLRVALPERALVVVSQVYYPAWRATIDGSPAPIEKVDTVLMGVVCEAGEHDILLTYDDLNLSVGWRLSALALACVLGLWVWDWRRRRQPGDPASSAASD